MTTDLSSFEQRIDRLLQALIQLDAENRRLRQQERDQNEEIRELKRKNELAKAKVEAIILRLRALENQEDLHE